MKETKKQGQQGKASFFLGIAKNVTTNEFFHNIMNNLCIVIDNYTIYLISSRQNKLFINAENLCQIYPKILYTGYNINSKVEVL